MKKEKTEKFVWETAQEVTEEWVYDERLDVMVLRERKVEVKNGNKIPFNSNAKLVRGK